MKTGQISMKATNWEAGSPEFRERADVNCLGIERSGERTMLIWCVWRGQWRETVRGDHYGDVEQMEDTRCWGGARAARSAEG
eukprot:scaffold1781_cov371-Pinguiococcus_pyrenoidosus.AAC.5